MGTNSALNSIQHLRVKAKWWMIGCARTAIISLLIYSAYLDVYYVRVAVNTPSIQSILNYMPVLGDNIDSPFSAEYTCFIRAVSCGNFNSSTGARHSMTCPPPLQP